MEEERKEKLSKKMKEDNQRMWLTLDRKKENLLDFTFTNCSDSQLLKQLEQDKTICTFMHAIHELSKRKLSSSDVVKLQDTLQEKGDQLDLYQQVECLRLLINQLAQLESTTSQQFVKAVNLLRANIIDEKTNTVKPNYFEFESSKSKHTKTNLYLVNQCLIKNLPKIKDDQNPDRSFQSSLAVETLLQILDQNDNSVNYYDDTYYLASVVESLLQTQNPRFSNTILKKIKLLLSHELIFPSYKFIIFTTIIKLLCNFLKINHISIKKNSETTDYALYVEIKELIKKISSRYDSLIIQVAYFRFQIEKKRTLRFSKHSALLLYALRKLESIRLQVTNQ